MNAASGAGGDRDVPDGLSVGPDGRCRCALPCDDDEVYRRYHDEEWGRPVVGDDRFFEKVCLEGFQSGLSWRVILHKRDAFREAFRGFAIERVAGFTDTDVDRLATDPGIVRNRAKIVATVHNAQRALVLRDEVGALDAWFWSFEPGADERPDAVPTLAWMKANPTSASSTRLAAALKGRGFRYVGPTTMYALMQAHGLVNDHVDGCDVRAEVEAERAAFARPSRTATDPSGAPARARRRRDRRAP